MSLQPYLIAGSSIGLRSDIKPYLIPDQAFSSLDNAYVWRERVRKRDGFEFIGRLLRVLTAASGGNINLVNPSPNTFNLFTLLGLLATEPNAQVQPGTATIPITIVIGVQTLTDSTGTGSFTIAPAGNITAATINYATGVITITFAAPAGPLAVTITMNYFPGFPVMGIWQRDITSINDEQTIFWDQKYAYEFIGTQFVELSSLAATTWSGTDSDFFWATNYRGISDADRLFFATNFVNNAANPIRYYNGTTWADLYSVVSQSGGVATRQFITQARIIIPYYGRLLMLNVWETGADGAGNPNYASTSQFFNRCRFSQIGNPLETTVALPIVDTAWRSDQFGKGGFIDAPTNEEIISAAFIKNTLIVFFERSTWQLRYVGEYGLPFLWERISSDLGSESTFSTVIFDEGVLSIGDRAIISANAVTAQRIDLQIPDVVFSILNDLNGIKRVCGVRDYQRELVFWCYPEFTSLGEGQYFPNKVLVYNYRNNTYAKFDDTVTFFGTLQPTGNITWSSTDVFWGDEDVLWDDVDLQNKFPRIVAGNQQGFVGYYGYTLPDETSLTITSLNTATSPDQITVTNHNLQSGEIIKITGAIFSAPGDPGLNGNYYQVQYVDVNTLSLFKWNGTTYAALDLTGGGTYHGEGKITVFPKLFVLSKDFNPYMQNGMQLKISYIDFLFDSSANSQVSIILYANSSPSVIGNLLVGNTQVETNLPTPYYTPASEYAWHRFFATLSAQFIRIAITYDDALMNSDATHASNMILNAYMLFVRTGGKNVF